MNNNTEFEFIKGYENLYKINRNGDIYSCVRCKNLSHQLTEDSYYYVHLKKEGIRSKCRIHRLLALQYIDNPNELPEVDHIDRNRSNNILTNLRWVTRVENRNNRADIIINKSDEEQLERLNNIREYKCEWAEKNRREKGCKIKSEMTKTKDPHYKAEWSKNMRATETDEHKAERLRKRREAYAKKEQTEEQKEKARERARKQREKKQVA
jgi:hypothetical protein